MPFNLKFGENTAVIIICGVAILIAAVFFIIVYVADFKDSRRKAIKKREFERSVQRAQRRKQRAR